MNKDIHIDIVIDDNDYIPGAIEVIKKLRPLWPVDKLQFKIFTDGITNKLVGIYYPNHYNDMVLLRIYGNKTDLLINRKKEAENIRILHYEGQTHALYATFINGLAYEFIQGEILSRKTVKSPKIYVLIAERLAQMHKLDPTIYQNNYDSVKRPMIWEKTEKFMQLMPKSFTDPVKQSRFEKLIKPFNVLEKEYNTLKLKLSKLESPIVFAHNDLLLANVLYNERENSVTFIDFEYTDFNYQAFDIANHFAEFAGVEDIDYSCYPDEEFQKSWLEIYLKAFNNSNSIFKSDIDKLYNNVNQFVLLAHFFWGCWALIQAEHSTIDFDFLQFAAVRFEEYFKRKANLL